MTNDRQPATINTAAPPAPVCAAAEIARLRADGADLKAIARSLNRRGIPTPSGRGQWWPETVKRHGDPAARQAWAAYIRRYRARRARLG